ncbi:DNA-directed RNA polymerase III subunit 1-like [Curcuma longa]|uniref:DNA-directed RNA polymerase III subunit 1-like n=1 Tax=Curcuma longa TaxID=136217 RepID=UPI003D9DDC88
MARREEKRQCTEEPCIEDGLCPRPIKRIRFSAFFGEEKRNSAEVQGSNNRNYGADLRPVQNGLLDLRMVQNNLCTQKNPETLVASTLASFLITRKDTFFDRAAFSLMCCYMDDAMDHVDLPVPAIMKPVELWTGKQLFSVLVRPNEHVNLIVKEKIYTKYETMCPSDGYVYFRNSELISGQLGKVTLGNGNKDGLFSVLLRDHSSHAAASCKNRLAKLSARWLCNRGFSIGDKDVHQALVEQPSIRPQEYFRGVVPNFCYWRCN